ncbi:hypothetical protein ACHAQH_004649 [Verticillium albo-atrum]
MSASTSPDAADMILGGEQDAKKALSVEKPPSPCITEPLASGDDSDLIKYSIEYVGQESGTFTVDGRGDEPDVLKEPLVLEYVEVRQSSQDTLSSKLEEILRTEKAKGHAYINIISPVVTEALRCVVEYFPEIDFTRNVIKIHEPYAVFVFYEKELTEYRRRLVEAATDEPMTCINRWADKHIGIAQDFVRQRTQASVQAERERHSRGNVTFDMLWLLYKPGQDIYADNIAVDEHDPFVFAKSDVSLKNGKADYIDLYFWNLNATSRMVVPVEYVRNINRFDGEKKILSLLAYPCDYLAFSEDVNENSLADIKRYFVARGKKWYGMRRNVGTHEFDGYTTHLPRRRYTSLAMVDPIQYQVWVGSEKFDDCINITHPVPFRTCSCTRCDESVYQHVAKPKFIGYETIVTLNVEDLTDHQYFLCDPSVETFLFKTRNWKRLHVDGFKEPTFGVDLFDRLVMKETTKQLIRNLTQMYIRDSVKPVLPEERLFTKISQVHKRAREKKVDTTWSADFVEGKGEGLTMLLHGRPGVGKTYTVGVKPEDIEENLLKWFKLAEAWGVVMLIDEADIYMEQRQVQDIARNHLVAGFLRALEYYKGILFLTTNRVGTFDEAFISRIHVQIYYPDFEDAERDRLWGSFFEKLENDRESTMRITQAAKDYIESEELRSLKWNGREIRNGETPISQLATWFLLGDPTGDFLPNHILTSIALAFQVAVALAEAQTHKDQQGRILIKPDHIKATVQMSKDFREYLVKLNKGDLSKKASIMGHRYDAFGKEGEGSSKY